MRKLVISGLIVVALAGLFAWRLYESLEDGSGGEQRRRGGDAAVAVETALVRQGEIRDVRTFTGTLQPRARFIFAPKLGGRLEELAVNIGDTVKAKQHIARLDDEEYVQQVNQAQATLEVAQAAAEQQATELDLAQREMERVKALRDKKIASEAEWDQAEAQYKAQAAQLRVAEAQVAEKRSALRAAEVRLSYTRISAPQDIAEGIWRVEERYVDEGAMLAANTPLVSVVDLGLLTAVIQIIERDYPAISEGLRVDVSTDAFPGRSFEGKVIRIAPVLREASRQARVEIEIPNNELLLRPGMFIRAAMEFAHHEDALLVPRTALLKREDRDGVFVIDETKSTARFVPVQTGIRGAADIEILEPELTGRVVTLGQHLLADGTAVILTGEGPEQGKTAKPDTEKAAGEAGE